MADKPLLSPLTVPWLNTLHHPQGRQEISRAVIHLLLRAGGFRRKKIPYKSQVLKGRMVDPPIWSRLKLGITDIGIYTLSLATPHPLPVPKEREWELGDFVLAYLAYAHILQQGEEPPGVLSSSLLAQLLAYPREDWPISLDQWTTFRQKGGDILLVYLENALAHRWADMATEAIQGTPDQALWFATAMEKLFALYFPSVKKESSLHLTNVFLLFMKRLLPYTREFLPQLRRQISKVENGPHVDDVLVILPQLATQLQGQFKKVTAKHRLEQTTSEILFLESYHKNFEEGQ